MTPLFSIVTICFNSEKTIERTIQSVLNQNFQDYEYLIIDGMSNDSTLDIVNKYIPQSEGRMHCYSEPDKGIYNAMNKGIKKSKGEYIWLVNSDDYIEPQALNMLYEFIRQLDAHTPSVLTGIMNLVEVVNGETRIIPTSISTMDELDQRFKRYEMGIAHPATLVHRKIYESIGLYDDRYYISADIDFFLRCMRQNIKVAFINGALTNMTMNGISNQLLLKKNIHDWNIRYSKFCNSKVEYCYYMFKSIIKLCIRKVLPSSFLNKIFYRK